MSMLPKSKRTDGSPYTGNQQFAGFGLMRSCGKCGKHKMPAGFRVRKPWGLVCPQCQPGGGKP